MVEKVDGIGKNNIQIQLFPTLTRSFSDTYIHIENASKI